MTTHTAHETHDRAPVDTSAKPDVLRRLAYIDGHLQGVRRMIEDDKYCVDVLKQTYAVRRAIEKLEALHPREPPPGLRRRRHQGRPRGRRHRRADRPLRAGGTLDRVSSTAWIASMRPLAIRH